MSALSRDRPRWLSPPALRAWLLVIVWLAMIMIFSSDAFSAASTASLLRPFLRWLLPNWTPGRDRDPALRDPQDRPRERLRRARAAQLPRAAPQPGGDGARATRASRCCWCSSSPRATSIRQSFSRARTGVFTDVIYDLAGGLAALGLAILWRRLRGPAQRRRRKP